MRNVTGKKESGAQHIGVLVNLTAIIVKLVWPTPKAVDGML